jgi:hypothetical protein
MFPSRSSSRCGIHGHSLSRSSHCQKAFFLSHDWRLSTVIDYWIDTLRGTSDRRETGRLGLVLAIASILMQNGSKTERSWREVGERRWGKSKNEARRDGAACRGEGREEANQLMDPLVLPPVSLYNKLDRLVKSVSSQAKRWREKIMSVRPIPSVLVHMNSGMPFRKDTAKACSRVACTCSRTGKLSTYNDDSDWSCAL